MPILRENLEVVFGCLKYHHYLYGKRCQWHMMNSEGYNNTVFDPTDASRVVQYHEEVDPCLNKYWVLRDDCEAESFQEVGICWPWYPCQWDTTTLTPTARYGYRKHLTSAYGNQPQWYSHQVRTLPGHMWYPCQLVKKVDIAVKSGTWWKVASATKGNRKCTANKEWATLKWMW